MKIYNAYGLHVASDIPLPELPLSSTASVTADVVIRHGCLPSTLSDASECGLGVSVTDSSIQLEWTEVGGFLIREGGEIVVSPKAGVSEEVVRLPLLGVVLGILLHQRGKITFHASAVSIGGTAAAFMGRKGAGKSTMVAALQARGHALLTDDVLSVDPETHRVDPAFPQIKLRNDAAEALRTASVSLTRLAPNLDKYALRSVDFEDSSPPLGVVFVLEEGASVHCTSLDELSAFLTLMQQGYASRFLGTEGMRSSDLQHHTALAKAIPVVRLQRPRDLCQLPEVCASVEAFVDARLAEDEKSLQAVPEEASVG